MNRLSPALLALTAPFCLVAPSVFAQPLPTDPSLVTGELENGLHYVIKKHAVPPGRAVIWIHIHSGSLNESDKQRGLAHYLEHMAFNGSANFAPGALVPFFQSLGMTFGRDQNAFTNLDQTTYQLTLPNTKPETLAKGLTFFADVTGRLSLFPKEIDAERQIIQEERRRGLSGRERTQNHVRERIAPGSLYGERNTIGKEETINAVKEQDFKDYYAKWYAASNATLMVVADTDPAEVVKAIKATFADLPKKPKPTPQDIKVKAYDKSFAIVASDPEVRAEEVRITHLEPGRPTATTIPGYRADLVGDLGTMALNRRLSDKSSRGGTSYQNAGVSLGNDPRSIRSAEMWGRSSPGKWKETLNEISLELQRARAFGFTARELDDARKEIISGAERAVQTEATVPSAALIARMNSRVTDGEPMMSPAQRLDLLKSILPSITKEEVSERFAKEFDPKAVAFIATLPSSADVPTEAALLELGTKALGVKPTPETESAHATTLMTELPKAGKTTESTTHEATKVWSGWLSNNIRVHYRFMDERKSQASIHIDLLGGEMLETAANRGITSAATLAWSRPSTQHLSTSDIREIMTGKKVSVRGGGFGGGGGGRGGRGGGGGGGGGGPEAISLTISGSPDELEPGFQLAHLLLTEPRIEQTAFDQFVSNTREGLESVVRNPQQFGGRIAGAAIYPTSAAATQPLTLEQLEKLTLPAAQAYLEKLITTSPIEVVIIGDIPRETILPLVEKYLGSLKTRDRVAPSLFAAQRKLTRPAGPISIAKSIETNTAQAYVSNGFYGADQSNRDDSRALAMAARILSSRMVKEVREEAQLVYSIGASSRSATTYPGFGVFGASAPTEPAKAVALVAKLNEMYDTFAKNGPTEEELTVAKKQMANTFETQLEDPAYWAGRLQRITFRDNNLDEIVKEPAAYQSVTAEQIKKTFAKYHTKENAITVVVTPTPAPAPAGK